MCKNNEKTAVILDGAALAKKTKTMLKDALEKDYKGKIAPTLAIIQVGNNDASNRYVKHKLNDCKECGITGIHYACGENISEEELLNTISILNMDSKVDGIIVQLPLPKHIDEKKVLRAVSPKKDVDCFHPENVGKLVEGDPRFLPCTPAGIIKLLKEYKIDLEGKDCVVVGRSNIVGKPIAHLLLKHNATVQICHSHTKNLHEKLLAADVVIAAAGIPKFIGGDDIKEGAVVVDVGINLDPITGKLCGDVDFTEVKEKASYITPVPGGVGPMTRATLMVNVCSSFLSRNKDRKDI